MNLKILGMALARDLEAGSSIRYIWQKFLTSPKAGRKDLSSNLIASSANSAPFSGETSIFAAYSGAVIVPLLFFLNLAAGALSEEVFFRRACPKRPER